MAETEPAPGVATTAGDSDEGRSPSYPTTPLGEGSPPPPPPPPPPATRPPSPPPMMVVPPSHSLRTNQNASFRERQVSGEPLSPRSQTGQSEKKPRNLCCSITAAILCCGFCCADDYSDEEEEEETDGHRTSTGAVEFRVEDYALNGEVLAEEVTLRVGKTAMIVLERETRDRMAEFDFREISQWAHTDNQFMWLCQPESGAALQFSVLHGYPENIAASLHDAIMELIGQLESTGVARETGRPKDSPSRSTSRGESLGDESGERDLRVMPSPLPRRHRRPTTLNFDQAMAVPNPNSPISPRRTPVEGYTPEVLPGSPRRTSEAVPSPARRITSRSRMLPPHAEVMRDGEETRSGIRTSSISVDVV